MRLQRRIIRNFSQGLTHSVFDKTSAKFISASMRIFSTQRHTEIRHIFFDIFFLDEATAADNKKLFPGSDSHQEFLEGGVSNKKFERPGKKNTHF